MQHDANKIDFTSFELALASLKKARSVFETAKEFLPVALKLLEQLKARTI